jgi:hypothetical protein
MINNRPPVERIHPPDALFRLANPLMRRLIASGGLKDLRFNVDRVPTLSELQAAIERSGLSIVRIYDHQPS